MWPRCLALAVLLAAGCGAGPDASVDAAVDAPACQPARAARAGDVDCFNGSCVQGRCSCTGDDEPCATDAECCGGACAVDGRCTPLTTTCRTSGNRCSDHGDCCSHYCVAGTCSPSPSYCTQAGDACEADGECCSGMCDRAVGTALGLCARVPACRLEAPTALCSGTCAEAGEVCGAGADGALPAECGADCCSRGCVPYGPTGVLVCAAPTGCRPTGEICRDDADCCGSADQPDGEVTGVTCVKQPGNPTGRCDQGTICTPAGSICRPTDLACNANANCCAGNALDVDTCRPDHLGVPRCTVAADIDCASPQGRIGEACATSADCCGVYPCVPDGAGVLRCAPGCVPSGGTCTTAADCCSRLPCELAPGASTGTCGPAGACADYGQRCDAPADCCNGVPCTTDGYCRY
jgi:hypothetical protein